VNLPTNIVDLAPWLILPAILGMIANYIINAFFANEAPSRQQQIKLVVFLLIGVLSYALQLIPADVLATLQPAYAILAAVLAAFIGNQILHAATLLGERLTLGANEFRALWHARKTKDTIRGVPITRAT